MSRVNEVNYNLKGTEMKIIEYYNASNCTIEFQDDYKYKVYNLAIYLHY